MEKYGVELDDSKTKTAVAGGTCPKCGARLGVQIPRNREVGKSTSIAPVDLGVPWCPNCGTEGFEKKP